MPITQGCRLTLIYNLLHTDKKAPLPKPPNYHLEQNNVATLLSNWAAEFNTSTHEQTPEKLIYLLEHAYTPAELAFNTLKNVDAAIADVLVAAAGLADCEIHLALVSVEESGSAEYTGSGRYWDEGYFEVDEVIDSTESVSEWRRPDGKPSQLPDLPFFAHEFCPPEAFEGMEPDDVEFHEATGNEGASFERTYCRAALVIWPSMRYLAIINQAGLGATLPILHDFCQQWETENKDQSSSLWHEAHTLAGYMLRDWLAQHLTRNYYKSSAVRDFLDYVYRLRDMEHLRRIWSMVAASGFYNKEDSAALVQAAELLPWPDVVNWTEKAISTSADIAQEACAALLADFTHSKTGNAKDLSAAAHTLFTALPGAPERFPQLQPWERSRITVNIDLVTDVLTGFSSIDAALAEKALDYLLCWPATYDMDNLLLPAALQLTETATTRVLPVVERLCNTVREHLLTRVAEALDPPADWRRDSQITCTCQDCAQLRIFLNSPTQSVWSFKAAEAKRNHIEHSIKSRKFDVNCVTERRSRPYSLVCTKNQASYQRRVNQRANDLDALAQLNRE